MTFLWIDVEMIFRGYSVIFMPLTLNFPGDLSVDSLQTVNLADGQS